MRMSWLVWLVTVGESFDCMQGERSSSRRSRSRERIFSFPKELIYYAFSAGRNGRGKTSSVMSLLLTLMAIVRAGAF